MSAFYQSDTILHALQVVTYLVLIKSLWKRYGYHLHFTDEDNEAQSIKVIHLLSQKQGMAEMRFKCRQSGSRANGKEENPRREKPVGQIAEVIRIMLVSTHCVPDTSQHLTSVCQVVSLLEKIAGVLCSEAALGHNLFSPLTGLCRPTCNCAFLGRDCVLCPTVLST